MPMEFGAGVVLAGMLFAATAGAGSPLPVRVEMIEDFNREPDPNASSQPSGFITIGDHVYFSAGKPGEGRDVWRTNGDPGGLEREWDLEDPLNNPVIYGRVGNRLIVEADTAGETPQFERNTALWAWDGATATRLWGTYFSNYGGAADFPNFYVAGQLAGRLFLTHSNELWVTDGTPAGTRLMGLDTGFPERFHGRFCSLGDAAVFVGSDYDSNAFGLYRTDGTANGTVQLAGLPGYSGNNWAGEAAALDGTCYLPLQSGDRWHLWTSDGTSAGTRELQSEAAIGNGFARLGNALYLGDLRDNVTRVRRWQPGGFSPIPVYEAPAYGTALRLAEAGGELVFFAGDTNSPPNEAVFLSDGTAAGTRAVQPPAGASTDLLWSTVDAVGNALVLTPDRTRYASPAWGIDPATARAVSLPAVDFFPFKAAVLGDRMIGAATDANGNEVWSTDATPAGTAMLHDVWAATRPSLTLDAGQVGAPGRFSVSLGDTLCFNDDPDDDPIGYYYPTDLWCVNGIAGGTRRLGSEGYGRGRAVGNLLAWGDRLVFHDGWYGESGGGATQYFTASPSLDVLEPLTSVVPWASTAMFVNGDGLFFYCGDSTTAIPWLCRVGRGGGVEQRFPLAYYNSTYFYPVGNLGPVSIYSDGRSTWRTDGTLPGTFEISYGSYDYVPGYAVGKKPEGWIRDGKLIVARGNTIHSVDGTVGGTRTVHQFESETLNSTVATVQLPDRMLLVRDVASRMQLWVTDGTAQGTRMIYEDPTSGAVELGGVAGTATRVHVLIKCIHYLSGCEENRYLVTDGTAAGTLRVAMPPGFTLRDTLLGATGNAAVFECASAQTGVEPCVAHDSGTASLLADIAPGKADSWPQPLGKAAQTLYFVADDHSHGREIWAARGDAIFADGFED